MRHAVAIVAILVASHPSETGTATGRVRLTTRVRGTPLASHPYQPRNIGRRVDAGYIVSPVGLGMMNTRPGVNPTILPHLSYVTPMPVFDPTAPRVSPIAATYPLGAQVTVSTTRWDARGAVVNSAPTRDFAINGTSNPRATPVVAGGAGMTPHVGLRVGVSFAQGASATSRELTTNEGHRDMTLVSTEAEYALHTRSCLPNSRAPLTPSLKSLDASPTVGTASSAIRGLTTKLEKN